MGSLLLDSALFSLPPMSSSSTTSGRPTREAPPTAPSRLNEDWLALVIGLVLFTLGFAAVSGWEPFGWAIKTNVWVATGKIMTPVSAKFSGLPGVVSLAL